ncbi:MAG: UDP-N-acetylglucosamine pyrophosphorylase [Clostridia bacterium]|nr:UDP-N-acetylglucosamine pyrophosphorylase [Clostridia bacterium]
MSINLTERILGSDASIAHSEIIKHRLPWQAIEKIPDIISSVIDNLGDDFEKIGEGVYVFRGITIPSSVKIEGRAVICEGAELRHGAYLRGEVIIGRGAVVGNSCEIKHSILYDRACVPHFNYVGNSLLSEGAHLGAGAVISNLKINKSSVKVSINGEKIDTGLRKMGAVVGGHAEIGCGSVLNPGTLIFPNALIYPLSCVRGTIPEASIYKRDGEIIKRNL